ncbi:hypothetical protein HBH56_092490 [Parastagonospora nodorum]|uniref:Uncharacterized protein n=1 Tax=Phaeosphaeria nodorum (strain SN15 / ATCC MYA-4574 / FGSC 10173) TaxID=321614 RepID=Q0UUV6_PHANO|nr:hypothetical protein SNOG_04458 [Parastagonospora nodorum SN15]KAH3914685.1 hypothetical protein HBH56_092490 [Parastagonospora nodorum]EAT88218.1 hypothetical protein SNOG_04458 [Parastagonospora nodorum SN15]KAH3936127.1 hypothetical protein HBH54_027140 [Parastagonospora nodorum]KAH3989803.1 hypothetical protein HBH52_016130 [Parastagonospora nodorum]KAH4034478.1 hypothetical protein HBI09_111010 [Parastagonospora nodorum]
MGKKRGSKQQENSWSRRLLDPIGNWLTNRAISCNENNLRKTRQYLNEIDPDSCLILLTKVLRQLLDGTKDVESIFKSNATTDRSGKCGWERDNFAGFLQSRLPGNEAVTASVPILWSDGSTSDWKDSRESYAEKVPQLPRIIFRSSSIPWVRSATPPSWNSYESLHLQDIKETISFTQPIITQEFSIEPLREADEEWEAAARRVQLTGYKQSGLSESPIAISKAHFERLVQLLFLQRGEDRCWRVGHNFYSPHRSGDIVYYDLSSDTDEISRAAKLAPAFTAYQFPSGKDCIILEQF